MLYPFGFRPLAAGEAVHARVPECYRAFVAVADNPTDFVTEPVRPRSCLT